MRRTTATQSRLHCQGVILSTLCPRTLSECEAKSSPVSRKVCTFKYLQAEHNVPATNVQVRSRSV